MSSATPGQKSPEPEVEFVVERVISASAESFPSSGSETPVLGRLVSRFGTFVLPFAAVASFAAPVAPREIRRRLDRASASQGVLASAPWLFDEWIYTEEPARLAEIRALNALLALPIEEGFSLDLDAE